MLPYLGSVRNAQDNTFAYAPAFFTMPPACNLIFQAVILRIHRRRQQQNALRQLSAIILTPLNKDILTLEITFTLVGFTETRIVYYLLTLRVAFCLQPFLHDIVPANPGACPTVHEEAARICGKSCRVLRYILLCGVAHIVLAEFKAAVRANPFHGSDDNMLFVMFLAAIEVSKHLPVCQKVELATVRALMLPFLLRTGHILVINTASAFYRRSAEKANHPVKVGGGSLRRQINRVAFYAGAIREAVHFIAKQNAYRFGSKAARGVRTCYNQPAAGKILAHDSVAGIAAFVFAENAFQAFGSFNHRCNTALGKILAVAQCGLNHHHGARVQLRKAAYDIVHDIGLAHLRAALDDNTMHALICEGIHDAALIRCSVGAPSARFC